MSETHPTLDWPLPSLAGSLVRGLLGFAARMFVGLLLLIVFLEFVDSQTKFWREMGLKLPRVCEQLMWFTMSLRRQWWPVLVLLVPPFDFAVTILLAWRFRSQRWLLSAWSQFWLLIAIFILFWVIMALTIPLTVNLEPPPGIA
jgi:hypothetical protein